MILEKKHNPLPLLFGARAGVRGKNLWKFFCRFFPLARNFQDLNGRGKVAATLASFAALLSSAHAAERTVYRDPALPENLPFSSAVVVGDTIYLSGEIGRAPGTTAVVEGGAGAETRQIFKNYERTLAELGSGLTDIVKCTVFLDDMEQYSAMNAAYAEFFPNDKPARSTLGADGLALGAAVEIECLAVKGSGKK